LNREDIIRIARQAGVRDDEHRFEFSEYKYLERFAALVIANHPPQSFMSWQEGYAAGVEAGQRMAFSKAEYTIGIDTAEGAHAVVVFRNTPGQITTLVAHAHLPERQT
jgi:hypothetical protein